MISSSIAIDSKLPQVGTTIFTVMSRLAADCGAINLSQGFPDFQAEPALFEAVSRAMCEGRNQYPPMAGVPELREAVAGKVESLQICQNLRKNPDFAETILIALLPDDGPSGGFFRDGKPIDW